MKFVSSLSVQWLSLCQQLVHMLDVFSQTCFLTGSIWTESWKWFFFCAMKASSVEEKLKPLSAATVRRGADSSRRSAVRRRCQEPGVCCEKRMLLGGGCEEGACRENRRRGSYNESF